LGLLGCELGSCKSKRLYFNRLAVGGLLACSMVNSRSFLNYICNINKILEENMKNIILFSKLPFLSEQSSMSKDMKVDSKGWAMDSLGPLYLNRLPYQKNRVDSLKYKTENRTHSCFSSGLTQRSTHRFPW
jgi:hypothetical protein